MQINLSDCQHNIFVREHYFWLYNRISYGEFSKHLKPTKDINRREFMLLLPLLIGVVLLGIYPNVILDTLHFSVSTLLYF